MCLSLEHLGIWAERGFCHGKIDDQASHIRDRTTTSVHPVSISHQLIIVNVYQESGSRKFIKICLQKMTISLRISPDRKSLNQKRNGFQAPLQPNASLPHFSQKLACATFAKCVTGSAKSVKFPL